MILSRDLDCIFQWKQLALNTSLDSLFEDLMHPNPRIQEDACRQMAETYASEALPRLLDLFGTKTLRLIEVSKKVLDSLA